jgi:hypothetical protein
MRRPMDSSVDGSKVNLARARPRIVGCPRHIRTATEHDRRTLGPERLLGRHVGVEVILRMPRRWRRVAVRDQDAGSEVRPIFDQRDPLGDSTSVVILRSTTAIPSV